MTISGIEVDISEASRFGVIHTGPDSRVIGFEEKPAEPRPMPGSPDKAFVSMGVYVFKRDVLIDMLTRDARREGSFHDFARDLIPFMYPRNRVFVYRFGVGKGRDSKYWRDIGTIEAYWQANIDGASVRPEFYLYDRNWPIRTY